VYYEDVTSFDLGLGVGDKMEGLEKENNTLLRLEGEC